MKKNVPLVTDVLEIYTKTSEGLTLWKTKGAEVTYENLLENIFILSTDLAKYFKIRHNNLAHSIGFCGSVIYL